VAKKKKRSLKIIGILFLAFFLISLWGLAAVAKMAKELPNPEQFVSRQLDQSTKIYDRAGETLLYEVHGAEKRTVVPFEEIPSYVKQATLAAEDQNFYNHPAFDWKGIVRAVITNIIKREYAMGGSTITQQLAKNAFLTSEKKLSRKAKELILAYWIEQRYSKDEILNLYLNQIPYGSNAYGIEAASQMFFSKSAKDLNLQESALTAAILQRPSYFSPWGYHQEELFQRKNRVLNEMFELGFISEEERDKAKDAEIIFAEQSIGSIKAPHFVMMVREYLNDKYGEDTVERGGLKVITTLDWDLQEKAQVSVEEGANRNSELYNGRNAALVAEDPKTGQILALVGSKNYSAPSEPDGCVSGKTCQFEGNFNVAAQGLRQPGSSFKPFAYLTAFEAGYTPNTVVFDVPTEFSTRIDVCPITNIDFNGDNDLCFHPQNFDHIFRGPINLRNALAQSINVPAVKVLYLAGIQKTVETAQRLGITTLDDLSRFGLSLVLGGGEVKLTELVGAYSAFANDGILNKQTFILEVRDSKNKVLEKYENNPEKAIEPQYVRMINNILSDIEARSPLFENSLNLTVFPDREVAMKTGTTNDYKDAWTMGYTPNMVVGVWTGNNNNQSMQKQAGSILAAVPIWHDFMGKAIENRPIEFFEKPEEIKRNNPILDGIYLINEDVHNILHYIDKNNPLGPIPAVPQNDPQYQNWELPARLWWISEGGWVNSITD
jgi:1A family penicillin-binding protein